MTESLTISARVVHALWKVSPQVFVESFRMLHDWSVERALFEGERLLNVFEIVDQPKMGPIHVFDRPARGETVDEATAWFGGNTLPLLWRYSASEGPPPQRVEEQYSEERLQEILAARRSAALSQLASEYAPTGASFNDVCWDEKYRRDWYGVRSLQRDGWCLRERLHIVALEAGARMHDRAAEILQVLEAPDTAILELEYRQAVVRLDNQLVFQLRRRARMSDDAYVDFYCHGGNDS